MESNTHRKSKKTEKETERWQQKYRHRGRRRAKDTEKGGKNSTHRPRSNKEEERREF